MKKTVNKKLVVTLVAGAMATSIAIGGAYAWFTSSAAATQGVFSADKVEITYANPGRLTQRTYGFTQSPLELRKYQMDLEQELNAIYERTDLDDVEKQYALDQRFAEYWDDKSDNTNLLLNEAGRMTQTLYTYVPGAVLLSDAQFINKSTVPVYLRVKKSAFTTQPGVANLVALDTAWNTDTYSKDTQITLLDGGDDYLYCTTPIEPDRTNSGASRIDLLFTSYVLGQANIDQSQDVSIGANDVEVIQAQNNAVYLDPSWKVATENGIVFIDPMPVPAP